MNEPVLRAIGALRSSLRSTDEAPKQGTEGGVDAVIEIAEWARPALEGIAVGDEILVLTWLDRADRSVLRVHPRDDVRNPITGVFATRSADRPNPIGLHPVVVLGIDGAGLRVGPIEAIDGTPVVDLKPLLR